MKCLFFDPFFRFTNLSSRLFYFIFEYVCICCFVLRLFTLLSFHFICYFFRHKIFSIICMCLNNFSIQNPIVYFNLMQHAPTARYIIKYISILLSRSFYEFSTMQMVKFHELEHSSAAPHISFYIGNFVLVVGYMQYIQIHSYHLYVYYVYCCYTRECILAFII